MVRDSAMAANIVFLSEVLYPNEKIIIWAHNGHINYNLDNYTTFLWDDVRLMGNWLHEFYNDEIYTIGLYSLRGEFSWAGETFPLALPTSKNSLEAIGYQMNKKYLFFDIKNHNAGPGNEWLDELIYTRVGDGVGGFERIGEENFGHESLLLMAGYGLELYVRTPRARLAELSGGWRLRFGLERASFFDVTSGKALVQPS